MIDATAIILAGGRSLRMKFNKAFAEIEKRKVIDIIIDKLKPVFSELVIISNQTELYKTYNLPLYQDIYPGLGPISGIHSGLVNATYDKAFAIGCDIPFIKIELVEYMFQRLDDYDSVVLDIDGYLQPTVAIYTKKCVPALEKCLQENKLKLSRIFNDFNTLQISKEDTKLFGDISESFLNLNDEDTLETARKIARRLL